MSGGTDTYKKKSPIKKIILLVCCTGFIQGIISQQIPIAQDHRSVQRPPNILFAIADDQSYPHASAYGQSTFKTPVFDSIAAKGILFTNAFVAAPQCSPSRAAILTGRYIWQLEEAGTHSSLFPKKFPVFTDALENAGYYVGFTGKPWAPGNFKDAGWVRNPVGPAYNSKTLTPPTSVISKIDYAANFSAFLSEKPLDQPFFFWYGGYEPHRDYEAGSGAAHGFNLQSLFVPPFLPNNELVKNDLLDYALEINWFDQQLGKMLQLLAASGELENTIVIVTADNGMAFPYAKANLQEYGVHVPLAICGPVVAGNHRQVDDLVSLVDLAPTFLDIANVPHFKGISGKTLMPLLKKNQSGVIDSTRDRVLTGRERHTHARPDNVGYPARAIRTRQYLFIENFKPERWPVGNPPMNNNTSSQENNSMKAIKGGYEDIDDSPTKSFMISNKTSLSELFRLGFEKRKEHELYDIRKDPFCLHDLSSRGDMKTIMKGLKKNLDQALIQQGDPRMTGKGDVFDSYPRYGQMRPFEGFKDQGKYNPAFMQNETLR